MRKQFRYFIKELNKLENEILSTLDNTYSFGNYYSFIPLGHPYAYLIDCRLNIFRGEHNK